MKKITFLILLVSFTINAQIPAGYYDPANGLSDYALKSALETIIDETDDGNGQPNHDTSVTYNQLWTLYQTSDARADGKVWDMYSDCNFTFVTDQDAGSGGTNECEKYNREHSFPRSWYGDGNSHPMKADAFHVVPTDKKVNGIRGNLAYGEVATANYTSLNNSKRGTSSITGPTGDVFEPADEYKGDIARGLFYVAVRYESEIATWETNDSDGDSMLDGSSDKVFEQWALDMLYAWHVNDPVSQKEIDRNEAIFAHQNNRNPFIDHPEWISEIWNNVLDVNDYALDTFKIYPNPTNGSKLFINKGNTIVKNIELYSISGKSILNKEINNTKNIIEISNTKTLSAGVYLLKIETNNTSLVKKIIIN